MSVTATARTIQLLPFVPKLWPHRYPIMNDNNDRYSAWHVFATHSKKERLALHMLEKVIRLPALLAYRASRTSQPCALQMQELLFPGYLFVRCDITTHLRWITATQGIRRVVQFGSYIPSVPTEIIEQLRTVALSRISDGNEIGIQPGTWAKILHGPFAGFTGMVSSERNGNERVELLLDFLSNRVKIVVANTALRLMDDVPPDATEARASR